MDDTVFVEKPVVIYRNGVKEVAIKVKQANKKTFKLELINYSCKYTSREDRCINSDDVIHLIDSKKNIRKNNKRKSKKNNKKPEEVYTQLEISMEDIEDSFDITSGDLFNYDQLEDISMEDTGFDSGDLFNYGQLEEMSDEDIERFHSDTSGDLFNIEQAEDISFEDIEKSMVLNNPDLFSAELTHFDFGELNEEEMKLAEASMWFETGEVEFE